jgi:hypothetical protein
VVWSGGKRSRARIDPAGTTRPGTFDAGQVIRLVLNLDKGALAAEPTTVLLDGGALSVALGANP